MAFRPSEDNNAHSDSILHLGKLGDIDIHLCTRRCFLLANGVQRQKCLCLAQCSLRDSRRIMASQFGASQPEFLCGISERAERVMFPAGTNPAPVPQNKSSFRPAAHTREPSGGKTRWRGAKDK